MKRIVNQAWRRWVGSGSRWLAAKRPLRLCATAAVLATLASAQQTESKPDTRSMTPAEQITIPDGTPVELRFTKAVWGKAAEKKMLLPPTDIESLLGEGEAKPGDAVRLVVAANVRVGDRVVIARGAVAQATVTSVYEPDQTYGKYRTPDKTDTGLLLRLDWIQSINDVEISLRASRKGESKPFLVEVLSANGQTIAQPWSIKTIKRLFTFSGWATEATKRNWVPAGTRITGFVRGPVQLDGVEVEKAQAQLPISNSTALLTIYRSRDHNHDRPAISCDDKPVAQIGARQYALLELPPGVHTCQVERENPLSISALAGEEYYLRLRPRAVRGGWELKLVSASEGEDGVAAAETGP